MDLCDLEIILSESFFGNKKNKKSKTKSKITLNRFLKVKKGKVKKQYISIQGNKVEVYDPQDPKILKFIEKTINKNYRNLINKILKDFYETYTRSWIEDNETALTKQEFIKNLTPESINVYRTNNKITDIEIAFDAKDMFLGHWLTIQMDMPSGKPSYTNMYG